MRTLVPFLLLLLLLFSPSYLRSQTVLAGWDVNGVSAFGVSPFNATMSNSNVTITGLTRGAGVTASGTAAVGGWGGNGWSQTDASSAISSNQFFYFKIQPKSGYLISLSTISPFDYRRSMSGPTSALVQYQVNSGAFVDLTVISFSSTSASGASVGSIDLSSISALQNIDESTVITIRFVPYGATAASGNLYIFDKGNSTATDFALNGTLTTLPNSIIVNPASLGPFCNNANNTFNIDFSSTGTFGVGNTYTAQLSDASGSFSSPTIIGTLSSSANGSLTISANISPGLAPGTGYKIRVVSTSPAVTGSSTSAFTFNGVPTATSAIAGGSTVCSSSTQAYSVSSISGVSYNWTVPADWSINSGQGANSISVNVGTASGSVQVTPSNFCGNGTGSSKIVSVISSVADVNSFSASEGNGQVALSWTNPQCLDEVLIVATDNTSVTSVPTGNGSLYVASTTYNDGTNDINLNLNEFAVYKGTAATANIIGLINGTTYTFKIFTRRGTSWSNGVSIIAVPSTAAGSFRSKQSGLWTNNNTWERFVSGSWVAALTGEYPNSINSDVEVRAGHTVQLTGIGPYAVRNLTVNGKVYTNNTSTSSNIYIAVYGNIICNGTIGNNSTYDALGFDIEAPICNLSGTGTFNATRIRKNTGNASICTFNVNMDVTTRWAGTQLYNAYSGTSRFDVVIGAGKVFTCLNGGSVSIDGARGNGAGYSYGSITVNGKLVVADTLFLVTTNVNPLYPCKIIINNGGIIEARVLQCKASGLAGNVLIINNGGKLNITGAAGFYNYSTTNNTYTINPGSTIQYSAVGNQMVETGIGSYSNLILSGGGNKIPNGTLTVKANLDIQDNAVLSGGTGTINVGGNWTNYAAAGFEEGTGTVIFNGTGNQAIATANGEDFYNMAVNKSSGRLNMASDVTVNRDITLTKGIISTGDNLLTWSNSGGILTSPISSNYKDSYICLCDATGTNPVSFTKPFDGTKGFRINNVKNENTWFPVGVDFVSPNRMYLKNAGTPDAITVAMEKGDIGLTNGKVVERIWYVHQFDSANNKMQADMRLFFTKRDWTLPQDEIESGYNYGFNYLIQKDYGDPNYVNVAKPPDVLSFATAAYDDKEIYGQYTILSGTKDTLGRTGITSFSRFSVMNPTNFILPVRIVNFKAYEKGAVNELSWENQTETGLLNYEVERSFDGVHYTTIGMRTAINNGFDTKYAFTDTFPAEGNNFYRIRFTEKGGTANFSYILNVRRGKGSVSFMVYPNPVNDRKLVLQMNHLPKGTYTLLVFDVLGQQVLSKQMEHRGGSATQTVNLPATILTGTYFVQLNTANNRYVSKLKVK